MTQPPVRARNAVAAHPVASAVITILVVADIWFSLYVPLYARATPKVGDFPFFYFYLIVYMPVTGVVLWIVYLLQKRLRPAGTQDGPSTAGAGGAR
jgi:Protein of unknown function (DUF3311)